MTHDPDRRPTVARTAADLRVRPACADLGRHSRRHRGHLIVASTFARHHRTRRSRTT